MDAKIAIISMIKDECDIIESFIRHNLKCADHIYLINHNSSDHTEEILKLLQEEDLPITIKNIKEIDHNQASNLSRLMQEVAALNEYDFIIPLDADEFIPKGKFELAVILKTEIPKGCCGQMRWINFAPTINSPTVFAARSHEPTQHYKTVIPNDIAKFATLFEGNHLTLIKGQPVAASNLSTPLYHIPVRSANQIIRKSIIGSNKLSIKMNRIPGEGFHWDSILKKLRENNFEINFNDLQEIALNYANESKKTPTISNLTFCTEGEEKSRYPQLSNVNLTAMLDKFILDLCNELITHRRANQKKQESSQSKFKEWLFFKLKNK